MFIQETHFTVEMSHIIQQEFSDFSLFHSFGNNLRRSFSIFFHSRLLLNIIDFITHENGRHVEYNIITLTLVNVHANNDLNNRNTFFNKLKLY